MHSFLGYHQSSRKCFALTKWSWIKNGYFYGLCGSVSPTLGNDTQKMTVPGIQQVEFSEVQLFYCGGSWQNNTEVIQIKSSPQKQKIQLKRIEQAQHALVLRQQFKIVLGLKKTKDTLVLCNKIVSTMSFVFFLFFFCSSILDKVRMCPLNCFLLRVRSWWTYVFVEWAIHVCGVDANTAFRGCTL